MKKKLTKREIKKALLYIGSPTPYSCFYQQSIMDVFFGEQTVEEFEKENKRRLKLYKRDWKEYHIQRKKELDELERLCKEEG